MRTVIAIEEIEKLSEEIEQYEEIISSMDMS